MMKIKGMCSFRLLYIRPAWLVMTAWLLSAPGHLVWAQTPSLPSAAGNEAAAAPDQSMGGMPAFSMPGVTDNASPSPAPSAAGAADNQAQSGGNTFSSENASGTDLPSGDGVNPRAPGLQLTPDASASGNKGDSYDPFAVAPTEPVKTPEQVQAEIRSRSFEAASTGLLPLRTNEIRQLLESYDKTQQAVETPLYPYPHPEVTVQTVSLDPGAVPPEMKVATGHVSTLNIMDITGAPWPIQDVSWAGNFEILEPETGGSVIRVTPMSEFAYGNMSIRLVGLTTPVTFMLKTHRDTVQYRFDARIAEYGPNAKTPVMQGSMPMVSVGDPAMGSILDGTSPEGAERLTVEGVDGRTTAYKLGKMTYVRTPLTMLSPGWSSSVSSGDGMNVYQMRNSPVLLLSDEGRVVRARLGEGDKAQ
jgi:intracellular multiplication protein IcmK